MFKVNQPMDLEGARNVRELGGYETADGHHTRKGVYLRADGTQALTKRDVEALRRAGVTLAVDLRSPDEVSLSPSRLAAVEGIRYENVVMFDGLQSSLFREAMPSSMAELYCRLLDTCQNQYRRIFRLFLGNRGISLFHCTAGKDRTGVVAMLLLQLAGAPDSSIIADYAASEKNMAGMFERQHERMKEQGIGLPDYIFGSREEDMERTLRHLTEKYRDAAAYLQLCGLSPEEITVLRNRFVE